MTDGQPRSVETAYGRVEATDAQSQDVELRYRPMMTVQTRVVSTFHVLPVRKFADSEFRSGDDVLIGLSYPGNTSELDRLVVDITAGELERLVEQGRKSLFVLPVHYDTLDDVARARDYHALAAERLHGFGSRIIIEIVKLPEAVEARRIGQIVRSLQPLARAVLARLPRDETTETDYRTAGLHAIGLDIYDQSRGEKLVMDEMDGFAEIARRNRIKSYVVGVRTTSLFTAAISSGFNYISGHVIGAACCHADDIRSFRPETLYRSLDGGTAPADIADNRLG